MANFWAWNEENQRKPIKNEKARKAVENRVKSCRKYVEKKWDFVSVHGVPPFINISAARNDSTPPHPQPKALGKGVNEV